MMVTYTFVNLCTCLLVHNRNGIIVDDLGTEWLVQLTNGKEVPVYQDEVFIIQSLESLFVIFVKWAFFFSDGKNSFQSVKPGLFH